MKSHSVEHRFFDNIWGWIPRDAELAWRSLMGEVLRSSGLPAADVAKLRPAAFSNRRTNHREKEINRHARSLSFAPGAPARLRMARGPGAGFVAGSSR